MGDYLIKEEKIINNYLLIREIGKTEKYRRILAEDMRISREVWIDVYPKYSGNNTGLIATQQIETIARKIKKINAEQFAPIHDLINGNEAFYIVMRPPKGRPYSQLSRCSEVTVRKIGFEIVRLMQWLQSHALGIDHLSSDNLYFIAETQKIQFIFNDGVCDRPLQESRENEIKIFGELLFLLITGEIWIEGIDVEKKIKENSTKIWSDLIFKILCDEEAKKIQRLEQLSILIGINPLRSTSDTKQTIQTFSQEERTLSNKIARLVLISAASALLYFGFIQTKADTLQNASAFDIVRFEMMGYIGVENAQLVLGQIFEKGYAVKSDIQKSIFWYKKAAQHGNIYAQMSLGRFYDQGIGVAVDKKQSLYWFTLAAVNGDKTAQQNIEIIKQSEASNEAKIDQNQPILLTEQAVSVPESEITNPIPNILENTPNNIIENKPISIQHNNEKSLQEKIMWQDNEDVIRIKKSWSEAINYCENLNLNGYSDWVLPDKELLYDLYSEQRGLKLTADDLYWTSSEYSYDKAWRVFFDYHGGYNGGRNHQVTTNNSKNDQWHVRCYRREQ